MSWIRDLRDNHTYSKVRRRMGKQNGAMAASWANASLWSIQEALDDYSKTRNVGSLLAAREGAIGLQAVLDDLLDKSA